MISILKWPIIGERAKGKLKKQILENQSGTHLLKLCYWNLSNLDRTDSSLFPIGSMEHGLQTFIAHSTDLTKDISQHCHESFIQRPVCSPSRSF